MLLFLWTICTKQNQKCFHYLSLSWMFIHLLSNTRIKVHFLVIFVELCSLKWAVNFSSCIGCRLNLLYICGHVCFRRYVVGRKCEWSSPKFKGFVRFLRWTLNFDACLSLKWTECLHLVFWLTVAHDLQYFHLNATTYLFILQVLFVTKLIVA